MLGTIRDFFNDDILYSITITALRVITDFTNNNVATGKAVGKRLRGHSPIRWEDQIRSIRNTKEHVALYDAKN